MLRRVFIAGVLSVSALVTLSTGLTAQFKNKPTGLFGSREIFSENMASFDKWTSMWRRHNLPKEPRETQTTNPQEDAEKKPVRCIGRQRLTCARNKWEEFITEHQNVDVGDLLKQVNAYMNRSPYIVDPVNWGLPDFWATPDEFFLKDGDCEDYAISKYVTLKRLGVDPATMRVVVLQDENLRAAHAVLAVEHEGETYILDNQVNYVLPHGKILHYRPVYSVNETGWWLHQRRRFSRR